jgi:type I restriction enzyme, S subunit
MIVPYKEITNREELRDHIHRIHDFLRNRGVGIGMTALKIFNLFYALKLIDDKRNTFNPPLSSVCSWNKIKKLKPHDILPCIVGRNGDGAKTGKNVLDELYDNESTRNTIFYDIPRDVKDDTYHKLIKMVDQIPISDSYDVDLAGKIYEYFIGYGDKTSMSELGAYFTDRHITTFIMNDIKPSIIWDPENPDIGYVPSMIDPFGGSGGFTLTFCKYMQEIHGNYIDWNQQIKNIHHYDLSEDVVKSASLEMFVLTGVFPAVNVHGNFKRTNSFENNYGNHSYDYIFSNPPYGGDKNKKNSEQIGIDKLIAEIKTKYVNEEWAEEQVKQLVKRKKIIISELQKDNVNINSCNKNLLHYTEEFGTDTKGNPLIKANDKEACSLLLFMQLIAKDGTVVGVLKEGVFFDSKYTELRKALIENFNVQQIISIPYDQFENTTTKTSIIIFKNNGKTKKVVFSNLIVNKYDNDTYEIFDDTLRLVHQKGQIKDDMGVEKVYVCEASYHDIINLKIKGKCQYSLNVKKYNVAKVECSDQYKLVKLGDLCELEKGKVLTKRNIIPGIYPIIGAGQNPTSYHHKANTKKNTILCSISGSFAGYISMYPVETWITDCFSIKPKLKTTNNIYIFSILKNIQNDIYKLQTGSTIPHICVSTLQSLQIPIPRTIKILDQWVKKIQMPYDTIQEKNQELRDLEDEIKTEVQRIEREEACDMMALSDLCEYIKMGKHLDNNDRDGAKYPYYGTNKIIAYTDNNNNIYNGEHILIARKGDFNVMYVNNLFCANDDVLIIKSSEKINPRYLYSILSISTEIKNAYNGSTVKGINKTDLKKIKLPVPQNKKLIKTLELKFKQIEQLNEEINANKQEYENVLKELADDIKKTDANTLNVQSIETNKTIKGKTVKKSPNDTVKKVVKVIKKKISTESESGDESDIEFNIDVSEHTTTDRKKSKPKPNKDNNKKSKVIIKKKDMIADVDGRQQ